MGISGKRSWFTEARFGIFAHFGLYTLLGGNENAVRKGSKKKYAALMRKFNPRRFNANEWTARIRDSGARYLVLTAKHAEGFCLWDSAHTPFKVTRTPFGRDLVAELAEACDKRNLRLGLYYNCNTWLNQRPDGREHDASSYPDFVEAQLRELMTEYGPIHLVWFDHRDPLMPTARMRKLKAEIHRLQPTAVVNDRGVPTNKYPGLYCGDYVTPERHIPDRLDPGHPFVECCDAMGVRGWGYHNDERFWSTPELLRRLSRVASLGSNYLLNVEPAPDGRIRPECVLRLQQMGDWLNTRANAKAVFATNACPLVPLDPGTTEHRALGVATLSGGSVFLHLHEWPVADWILVPGLVENPRKARLAGSRARLNTAMQPGSKAGPSAGFVPSGLLITGLPEAPPNNSVNIIRLDFARAPRMDQRAIAVRQKITVTAPRKETVHLLPEQAELRARGGVTWHTINRFANGNTSIGHMIRAGCEIRWHLAVQATTTYNVHAELGTMQLQSGARFSISVGRESVEAFTRTTGWYDTPVRTKVGKLKISKGRRTLVLRVLDMPGTFSDVHGLVLQPV